MKTRQLKRTTRLVSQYFQCLYEKFIYLYSICLITDKQICKTKCGAAQLLLIRFWRIGHGQVVSTMATTVVGGEGCLWDSGAPVRNWPLSPEAIRSSLLYIIYPLVRHMLMSPPHKILMAKCKTAVTPLLTHWSYCSLALSHRYYHWQTNGTH